LKGCSRHLVDVAIEQESKTDPKPTKAEIDSAYAECLDTWVNNAAEDPDKSVGMNRSTSLTLSTALILVSPRLFPRPKKILREWATTDDVWVSIKRGNKNMIELIRKFIRDEEGQDLVEYALLLVFLALAAIAILPTLGSSVNKVFSQSNSSLNAS